MAEEKRFAVLIDSDNVSSMYIRYILDELSNYGITTYKRIYGDFTSTNAKSWKDVLLDYSITPMQQYPNTKGKNATDSAMIIDAMDILYTGNVEGFCIVSSDSDFTRLASRLREAGKIVIGMGEEKTPKAFCVACDIFKYLEILISEDEEDITESSGSTAKEPVSAKERPSMTNIKTIEEAIKNIIIDNGTDENGIDMGELGSRIQKRYPDFDTRNYNYSKLSKFLAKFDSLTMTQNGSSIMVRLKAQNMNHSIEDTIIELVKKSDAKGIHLGTLSQQIRSKYPHFNVKETGYSKFEQYIRSFDRLSIITKSPSDKRVTLIK